MRVSYDWTHEEWHEAVTLATAKRPVGGGVSGMVYALIGIPLVGAALDGVRALGASQALTLDGAVVPLLLVLLFVCLTAGLGISRWGRRKRMAAQVPMPPGLWEAVLQEAGWSVHEKAGSTAAWSDPTAVAQVSLQPRPEENGAPSAERTAEPSGIGEVDALRADRAKAPVSSKGIRRDLHTVTPLPGDGNLAGADLAMRSVAPPSVAPPSLAPQQSWPVAPPLQPWHVCTGSRTGERVLVLLHAQGFVAIPVRCMSADQASRLHRMILRKLRPSPATR